MNRADSNSQSRASVRVEANVGESFWRKSAKDTLPPPDMVGPYMRNRPVPGMPVPGRKAWIIGSGIAGMAAAFYLIRDGGMKGEDITILDGLRVTGGSLDGSGNAEDGYIVRGGREMNWNYDNFWDLFQDVPALELPAGYSVLDEYRWVNDNDPNWSKARLMHKQGQLRDFATLGLSKAHQWEIVKLLLKRKEDLDDVTIEEYFSKSFLETNFWYLWRSMFAFENWQSLLEMKLYMHRFLDAIDGLTDMSALVFPKYNQYDSFVVPLTRMLQEQGVRVQFDTRAHDLDLREEGGERTVTAIRCKVEGREETIAVGADDVVFAIAAPIRLTYLGIRDVPQELLDAGKAFGCSRRQLLSRIELPHAMPSIAAGITQCIMLSLSMVVIAALVGADGLGKPVVNALNTADIALGFEAGLAIVLLAIMLDRICKQPDAKVGGDA